MVQGVSFEDARMLMFDLTAADDLSGVAEAQLTMDGTPCLSGAAMDFAGQLGLHTIGIVILDRAGNRVKGDFVFLISTSIASLRTLINNYITSGALAGPVVPQLTNSLDQAEHQLSKGAYQQAVNIWTTF